VVFATPVLWLSLVERPLQARVPPGLIGLAGAWWLGFLCAALVVALWSGDLAVTGLLLAASELAGAATIWFARSESDGGGGGGDDRGAGGEPGGPPC